MGAFDSAGNVFILWAHGARAGPVIQASHAAFGAGALAAPIFIAWLGDDWGTLCRANAAVSLLCGLSLALCETTPTRPEAAAVEGEADAQEAAAALAAATRGVKASTLVLFFFYSGLEGCYALLLFTFAVEQLSLSAAEAAALTSAFWLCLLLGRILAVCLSVRLRAAQLQAIDMTTMGAALGVLLLVSDSRAGLWVVTCVHGLGIGSFYASAFSHCGDVIVMSGALSTGTVITGSVGKIVLSVVFTSAYSRWAYLYPILLVSCWVASAAAYAGQLHYGRLLSADSTQP